MFRILQITTLAMLLLPTSLWPPLRMFSSGLAVKQGAENSPVSYALLERSNVQRYQTEPLLAFPRRK